MHLLPFLFLFVFSCIEYSVEDPGAVAPAVPNPQELESTWQEDRHQQVEYPQVDVLWVIDNSCSMANDQLKLIQSFPGFMDFFIASSTDYHVGVVSTDMVQLSQSGRLQEYAGHRWIDPNTLFPYDVFNGMALMGTGGSGNEQGIDATYAALTNDFNSGFIRSSAPLHIIVISDEPDYSDDISMAELVSFLDNMKFNPSMTTFSGIIPLAQSTCTWIPAGTYSSVAAQTGGVSYDICLDDWEQVLTKIGIHSEAQYKREFELSHIPVPQTISVKVVDHGVTFVFEEGADWEYNQYSNSIYFLEYTPAELSEVYINYMLLDSANLDDIEEYADTGL